MRKLIALLAVVSFYTTSSFGQIQFELLHDTALDKFTVALSSEKEMLTAPDNRTSSAQITIRAKSGTFQPDAIKSLIPDVVWAMNSEYKSPEESPEFDYYSFTMESTGTDQIKYLKDTNIPVFEFINGAQCGEKVEIINNQEDPFKMPNSSNANIGNYISILGSRQLNSYIGSNSLAIDQECAELNTVGKSQFDFIKDYFTLAPNLISTTGNLVSTWDRDPIDAILTIRDVNGRKIGESSTIRAELNSTYPIDLSQVSEGIYYIELSTDSWQLIVDRAIKIKE